MKEANNITAKLAHEEQLNLPCPKLNLQKKNKLTKSMNNILLAVIEKGHYTKMKGFKDSYYVFVIRSIIGVDQFWMI